MKVAIAQMRNGDGSQARIKGFDAARLYDQLAVACVRPPGMVHLENPSLTNDLGMARDFDLGITGPPMSISMAFIASDPSAWRCSWCSPPAARARG